MLLLPLLLACADKVQDTAPPPWEFPGLDAAPGLRGPGGPSVSFSEDQLWQNCASLLGGEEDVLHHNLVMPYRGHLVLPWAPEFGGGGVSLFDMSDPCNPVKVGGAFDRYMRETHAVGFLHLPEGDEQAGDYAVVTGNLGIEIWDISDPEAPAVLSYTILDGIFYPDAYARVVLSVFWQHPWLFVAGADNGLLVVNTSNLAEPEHITTYVPEPGLRAGGVFVMGNTLMLTSAEGGDMALLDVSIPDEPQPIPGGRFTLTDGEGNPTEAYHANLSGDLALFARKEGGGGVIAFDISDRSAPSFYAEGFTPGGNGGYVFHDEGFAFVGDSHWGKVFDIRDPDNVIELGTGNLPGDLDTFVPYGNVGVLSVDDDAEDGIASAVMPWTAEPDTTPPVLLTTDPRDGDTGVATSARIGLGFNEPMEAATAFAGSIRLYDEAGYAVDGYVSVQEGTLTYAPKEPLQPGMTYEVQLLAGGLADLNMNAIEAEHVFHFTTAGAQ
ncbi:MAG: Ig-like domain-containing protein [Alphaproteobacteria bacterium]|nr:Ig-like domain-containing protein [Alphaproteobacteria bacterium]